MYESHAAASDAPQTFWIQSEPISDLHRLRSFQEDFMQFMGGIQIEPLGNEPMVIQGSITAFDDTMISMGQTTPSRCIHPYNPRMDDCVALWGWPRGACTLQAAGQRWDMADGEVVFSQVGLAETLTAHTDADLRSVTLSRAMLAAMRIDVDAILLRPLQGNPAASMLMGYAFLLRDHSALATPALRRAAVLHLHDLAALAAGAVGDVAQQAQLRGARAARVLAIRQDIAQHFTDANLSVSAVALRQGISPRYLHMLLEGEGLSFSALVLEQRLQLAEQWLRDPRLAARSISEIAFEVGFGDLSYFNRCFRRWCGATPSEVRNSWRH